MQNASAPELFGSLRQLAATALDMLHTRLALAGIEFEEELQRLLAMLLLLCSALICAAFGLGIFTWIVVLLFDDTLRIQVLSVIGMLYIGGSIFCGYRLKSILTTRPPLFSATLAELEKDHLALHKKNAGSSTSASQPSAALGDHHD